MPTCRYCGDQIRWAKQQGEDRMVPLTVIGEAIVLNGHGHATTKATFRRHQCDPDRVEAHAETLNQRAAYIRDRDETNAAALRHPCPKCGARIAQPCMNLNDVKTGGGPIRGSIRATRWPHQERIPYSPHENVRAHSRSAHVRAQGEQDG